MGHPGYFANLSGNPRMEPDITRFLIRIVNSLAAILAWMMVNIYFGLGKAYAFFEEGGTAGSIVFYAWMVLSLLFLWRLYRRWWRDDLRREDGSR